MTDTRPKTRLTPHHLLLLIILSLAWGARLYKLADHNIWWDEGWSTWVARHDLTRINHIAATDVHPPLYLWGLHAWGRVVGEGEFVSRFLSAVAGTLTVVAIYGLGRSLGGRRVGLLSALWLAVSRFAINWSQEMRMYILAALWATLALWAALRYWRTGGRRAWVGYVLAAAAGLWTLYLSASTLLVVNLAWLAWWRRSSDKRRRLIGWAAAQGAVLALFAPWLVYALSRIRTETLGHAVSPATFLRLYATLLTTGVPVAIERYTIGVGLVVLVLLAGLVALWRERRTAVTAAGAIALLAGLLLPAAIVYTVLLPIDFFYTPSLEPRYLLVLSSCFYVLLAWGIIALARRRRWWGWLSGGVALTVALVGLADFYPGRFRYDDYASLAITLKAHVQPGDAVVLQDDTDWPIFAAHYPGYWHGVPSRRSSDPVSVEAFLAPIWAESEGVWLVLTLYARQSDPAGQMQRWLAERAPTQTIYRYGASALHFYPRTAERAARANALAPDHTIRHALEIEAAPDLYLVGAETALSAYRVGSTLHLFLYWEGPTAPVELALVNENEKGQVVRTVPVHPPPGSERRRQQVDLPLTAELSCGRYTVRLQEQAVVRFDLTATGTAPSADQAAISHPLDLRFADPLGDANIHLLGYDLGTREVQPEGMVELTLYWRAATPVAVRFKVFTHLLGEQIDPATASPLWGQHDAEPDNFSRPTTTWAPGEIVIDRHSIPVKAGAPPGRYNIAIGLYDGLSGTRLAVYSEDDTPLGDHVILDQVTIP